MRLLTKSGLFIALTALMIPLTINAGAADFIDEQVTRQPPPVNEAGWTGAYVDDSNILVMQSSIYAGDFETVRNGTGIFCNSFDDVNCKGATHGTFTAYLPVCNQAGSNYTIDCIESVDAIKADGTVIKGTFGEYFPSLDKPVLKGDSTKGVPDGWNPSLWTFPGITHAGGDKFFLASEIVSYIADLSNPSDHLQLFTTLFPVSLAPNGNSMTYTKNILDPNGKLVINGGRVNHYPSCQLWLGNYQCAVPWAFPENVRYRVNVKTSGPISGWINGRINEPAVNAVKIGKGTDITVEAAPVQVPVFSIWKKFSELKPETKSFLLAQNSPQKNRIFYPDNWRAIWDGAGTEPFEKISTSHDLDNHDQPNFNEFLLWLAESDNKAVATKSQWGFYTNHTYPQADNGRVIRLCSEKSPGLAGIVSTNATMYLSNPPSFNQQTQTLDYQVSSPHFDRNGKENLGTYDLLIKSDVARCIYGYSNAPIQASVSIINSSGEQKVATSTLTEKDGWLKLSVKGFGYSAPTLKVKLTQEAPAPAVIAPAPIKRSTTTITCVKGKTSKKVTGTNPKCPSGYKKK